MLFTTFPVRKTLNTKHIKRYATAHKSIKNTNLPGYRQSFPKCRLFHEYAHSREAGRVTLALIRAAALKTDGTALSTELVLLAELSCTQVPSITSTSLLPPLAELQPVLTSFPVQTLPEILGSWY